MKKSNLLEAEKWLASSETFEKSDLAVWIRALIFREQKKFKEAQELLSQLHLDGQLGARVLYNRIALDLDLKNTEVAKQKINQLVLLDSVLAKELQGLEGIRAMKNIMYLLAILLVGVSMQHD